MSVTIESLSLQNAFESQLTAEVGPAGLTYPVGSIGSLTSSCIIVLDYDNDTLREYIECDGSFGASSFTSTDITKRYLAGSAAGSNLTHAIGAKVVVVPTQQHFEHLYSLIAALSHADFDDIDQDQHTQYAPIDGSRDFTGTVGGIAPSADADFATKSYVDGAASGATPTGIVAPFAGAAAPAGWLMCDGSSYTVAAYPTLHGVIGDTFGGDGGSNFNVPDMRDRFPLGANSKVLGSTGGTLDPTIDISHTHTIAHTHTINHGHADTIATAVGGAHTHTMPTHVHTMPTHTHTVDIDHDHGSVTSASDSHTHSFSDTSGGPSSTTGVLGGAESSVGTSTHTHYVSGTTGSDAHSHSVDLPNYNVANRTTTAVDPGNTNSTDPGDTNTSTTHSHTVTGGVTDHSGSSGASSATNSGSGGSAALAVPNAPYMALNYIIKT